MNPPLLSLALRMGDNALIIAQQNSKWCGHAPTLEDDIALSNIALDLLGQAQLWLDFAGICQGKGQDADRLAFFRDSIDYRNALLCEQPNGNFAQTLMRQYLFDVWHLHRLQILCNSSAQDVADIAHKSIKEVQYHYTHSRGLIIRLGDGTAQSHDYMQSALDLLYPYFISLFEDAADDALLAQENIAPPPSSHRQPVLEILKADLYSATLTLPASDFWHKGAVDGKHTEHLGHILAEMQFLQRTHPGLEW